ncbi:DUF554 domain-containing protein [Euhalothece natronophila Z-M001]|uniref:DUF554 domain-containing protein n=1 Tax=Euhalothece natronophila Z-M001 TaxID=522448 RepID=A0A5B8NPS3_9CHRO|nr:DUF554 domain-containing protein [Euhalothece natronophila]QDZ41333.1 DUF554 domain-containing protein [Euhalothece natronophila Z-M001]
MLVDFWFKTSGTWINVITVVIGTIVGVSLRQKLPSRIKQIIPQGIGLLTLWLGISMTEELSNVEVNRVPGVILGLIAIALGGALGEWWGLEEKLNGIGDWLQKHLRHSGQFTEGFVATSILFCVGPVALIGSINNGLLGDNTLLVLKAMMDGFASIPFASRYGIGVGFSSLVIIIYQGGVSLLAGVFATGMDNPETDPRLLLITGIGGLMILGIGLNLLEIAKVRVASFLPALVIAPILYQLIAWF